MNTTYDSWVAVWGNAMSILEHRPEGYAKNITLRYPIYCPFSGAGLRLTFDNYCGTEPVTLSMVTVLLNGHFYPVLFHGASSVTIPAGELTVSDPLTLSVTANDTPEVSIYLGDYTQMRSSVFTSGPLSCGQYGVGDLTEAASFPMERSRKLNQVYFLSTVSLLTHSGNRAVVCYGDSITAQAWPDYLALRCRKEGFFGTSIIRRATSGSRILREYDCITYESYGLKGTRRFAHEVPTDGADTVIIQQGINDIIHPVGIEQNPFRPMSDLPTVNDLIDGLKWYIEQARTYGYKVYLGTLLPIEGWRTYAPFREEMRNALNDWMRQTDLADGCVDFDLAVRDAGHPARFAEGFDSGDHLHPSLAGYQCMANAVPATILKT